MRSRQPQKDDVGIFELATDFHGLNTDKSVKIRG